MKYELQGAHNTAHIFATEISDSTMSQIITLTNQEWLKDSHIAVMADAHAGKGCTVGTTISLHGKISPNLVGVDIGCGILIANLGKSEIDLKMLDDAINERVPAGFSVHNRPQMKIKELKKLLAYGHIKKPQHITQSLGTLGGGNHFIEIDIAEDGTKYLVIHSGSRNLGKQIAEHYQGLAIKHIESLQFNVSKAREELIAEYKAKGLQSQLPEALKALNMHRTTLSNEEKDLAYLEGQNFVNYLHDMRITQEYASRNREHMANIILNHLHQDQGFEIQSLDDTDYFQTIHNYIDVNNMILRKGAISAKDGELVIIPINMRDGCILAKGKGNKEANMSGPHGAGRMMSRGQAKAEIDIDTYKAQMEGIFTTSVNESTLDEAPDAYKPIDIILDDIQECVEVIEVIKPIYSFKSSK